MVAVSGYRTRPVSRSRRTKKEIEQLDSAIVSVVGADHPMTVRGVFYRVMSAGLVDKSEKGYAAVQRRVLALRRAGVLPYAWVADGTRWTLGTGSWSGTVEEYVADAAASYRRAMWRDQPSYVEVWSEKDAISSIVSPITSSFDVPLLIARGFASETFLWSTANTIRSKGKPAVIYQLGDHDPSGVAAWEHVQIKLREFAPQVEFTFHRLAVTEEQIVELDLPTRPTKASDSRSRGFAGQSVEVDAISPSTLKTIVEDAIVAHIDPRAWQLSRFYEDQERQGLIAMMGGAR